MQALLNTVLRAKKGKFSHYAKDECLQSSLFPARGDEEEDRPLHVDDWHGLLEPMDSIEGITSPMLYFAETLSPFCAHEEDARLGSASFLAGGSAWRMWFFTLPKDRDRVLDLFWKQSEALSREQAECRLASRTYWLDPHYLVEAMIPVYYQVQHPGSFM